MSLLVLTNNTSSLSINPPATVTLKVGLTPAGAQGIQGIQGDPVPLTDILGQSTNQAPSQKLLTDEVTNTNNKVVALEGVSGKVKNGVDGAILEIWVVTQAELDAIAVKADDVIYMVKA